MKNNIVAFCGAGGTGKTVVLEALSKKLTELGIEHKVHYSIVREFYASKGIASEADLHKQTEEEKVAFQFELAQFFIRKINEVCEGYNGYVLCDRSIFDHFAYWTFSGINSIKLSEIRAYQKLFDEYLEKVNSIWYFPYPAEFSKDVDPDSFRWAPPAKNLIIDSLILRQLEGMSIDYHWMNEGSIESRVNDILHYFKVTT